MTTKHFNSACIDNGHSRNSPHTFWLHRKVNTWTCFLFFYRDVFVLLTSTIYCPQKVDCMGPVIYTRQETQTCKLPIYLVRPMTPKLVYRCALLAYEEQMNQRSFQFDFFMSLTYRFCVAISLWENKETVPLSKLCLVVFATGTILARQEKEFVTVWW